MTIRSNTQLYPVAKVVPETMRMMKIIYKEVGENIAATSQWKLWRRQHQGPTSPRRHQKLKQKILKSTLLTPESKDLQDPSKPYIKKKVT